MTKEPDLILWVQEDFQGRDPLADLWRMSRIKKAIWVEVAKPLGREHKAKGRAQQHRAREADRGWPGWASQAMLEFRYLS